MSRPLLGVLLAVVVFAALWVTMLKPHGSGTGTAANPSLGQMSSAVAAAREAVGQSNAAAAASGGTPIPPSATTPSAPASHAAAPARPATTHHRSAAAARSATRAPAHHRARAVHHAAPPLDSAGRIRVVADALAQRRVLAMLFYNPAGAADRLVRRELGTISTHAGAVVKLAIPLSELARYGIVTQQVPVTGSPTLVIVDRRRGASELVGFAGGFEIAQRIADALAVR